MKSTLAQTPSEPLPPYLARTDVMELDDLPLQVSLLTMEVAAQRLALQRISDLLNYAASLIQPASLTDA